MERALQLAALGREWVSPNPMVGCVIVYNNEIIGEGFHQKFGQAHAEVNAVNSVKNKELLKDSTVFVTLEPCAHYGKTPPCAELLIKHKVKKVVICNEDPFPKVSGRGIEMLKNAGIEVETGLLAEKGKDLNKRFFKAQTKGLPYVILKWAETADGFIAEENGKPFRISNTTTDIKVHQWRSEEDAILVGKNTVLNDNPSLNVRHWTNGKQPIRVIFGNVFSGDFKVLDGSQKTLIFNSELSKKENNTEWIKTESLEESLRFLVKNGIHSVLVEGGKSIHESFMNAKFFDEIRIIKSDKLQSKGLLAPRLCQEIKLNKKEDILNDTVFYYERF